MTYVLVSGSTTTVSCAFSESSAGPSPVPALVVMLNGALYTSSGGGGFPSAGGFSVSSLSPSIGATAAAGIQSFALTIPSLTASSNIWTVYVSYPLGPSNSNYLYSGGVVFTIGASGGTPPIAGCTNPAALNYNAAATVDNGTCIMPVLGCTNAGATNYNPAANVDNGTCTFAPVPGCTNPRAINYNPSATTDNGSCILPVPGCTIAGSLNYNPAANVNDGSCVPITRGCTVPGAVNYSASANRDDGSCVYPAAPGIPAASVAACCNWTDGDVVPQAAWQSMDNCGNNTFIVITSPSATIAAQAAQIAALQAQVLALAHIDEGILP